MASMCYITESAWNSKPMLSEFQPIRKALTMENIATLVETFEVSLIEIKSNIIKNVLVNKQGYFLFLVDYDINSDFDFYKFLNDNYTGDTIINCMNVKWIFPKSLSKGIYTGYSSDDEDSYDEDNESTGYMDESDLKEITGGSQVYLYYLKTNARIPIPASGVVIGRSARESDYVIHGNSNLSRTHCKLYKQGNSIMVLDEKSSNGTYINGLKVKLGEPTQVHLGDTLMMADEEFTIVE